MLRSRLLQHPARKRSRSILTTPEPAWGALGREWHACDRGRTQAPARCTNDLNHSHSYPPRDIFLSYPLRKRHKPRITW